MVGNWRALLLPALFLCEGKVSADCTWGKFLTVMTSISKSRPSKIAPVRRVRFESGESGER
jgi:hypothetical protein